MATRRQRRHGERAVLLPVSLADLTILEGNLKPICIHLPVSLLYRRAVDRRAIASYTLTAHALNGGIQRHARVYLIGRIKERFLL